MPISLLGFSSSVNGRDVKLNWITENEENNTGFEVQKAESRSQETEWKNIGFIQGKGNSNEPVSYCFEDRNLSSGKYKYRLKQIDYNGNYEYFELENEVIIGVPKKFELAQNYPNPFNPVTNINFDLPESGLVSLKIFDLLGREVAIVVNEFKEAGYYTVQYNAEGLSSGIYFYRLEAYGNSIVRKLAVMK
ncbi:MAG: T9SS type A sorting domain-containing protein [Ignavibacteria bacterium]|nr:T9SS type A sorting domain-containing protein [Ignavibacteria bacterium]